MELKKITEIIEQYCPLELAESWDNSGLLLGHGAWEISRILLAVDVTEEVIEEAVHNQANLIITHHPMIFKGIKGINSADMTGRRILRLMEHNIACYAMHTNFDALNKMSQRAAEILALKPEGYLEQVGLDHGVGYYGTFQEPVRVRQLCETLKSAYNLEHVMLYGDPEQIVERGALCPGSGKDFLPEVIKQKAQVYITGDFTHHFGIDALAEGVQIIDAGHYGLESVFVDIMGNDLKELLPEVEILSSKSGDLRKFI